MRWKKGPLMVRLVSFQKTLQRSPLPSSPCEDIVGGRQQARERALTSVGPSRRPDFGVPASRTMRKSISMKRPHRPYFVMIKLTNTSRFTASKQKVERTKKNMNNKQNKTERLKEDLSLLPHGQSCVEAAFFPWEAPVSHSPQRFLLLPAAALAPVC